LVKLIHNTAIFRQIQQLLHLPQGEPMLPKPWDLLLRRCRLLNTTASESEVDIAIVNGKIAAIAPHLTETCQLELDIQGKLVSPPFVESHMGRTEAKFDSRRCQK
jgi:N-acyl-D-aspartate/D-glutamate deacylase